jgi:hypothetical protein
VVEFVLLVFVECLDSDEVLEVEESGGMLRLVGDDNGNFSC